MSVCAKCDDFLKCSYDDKAFRGREYHGTSEGEGCAKALKVSSFQENSCENIFPNLMQARIDFWGLFRFHI